MAKAIGEALVEGPRSEMEHFVRSNFSVNKTVESYLELAGVQAGDGEC